MVKVSDFLATCCQATTDMFSRKAHINILLFTTAFVHNALCALLEPIEIEILPGPTVQHFSIEYCTFSVAPYITTMNAHCYCRFNPITLTSSDCSIPGPTFIFHPATTVQMTFHNRLSGDSASSPLFDNLLKDLDITNVHLHGLHVSPAEDDVFVQILPGQSHTYTYTIPADHYPGTHWLHAHHHGSVSLQVTSGLFSALLVKYADETQLNDDSLINMKENLLIFHWYYVITSSECDCTNTAQWQQYFYFPPQFDLDDCISGRDCFQIISFCYEYCSMPLAQRTVSGFTYDMQSDHDDNFQLFLVNGQFQPIIDDLTVDRYRRLRFVNAISQYYIQYVFPITNCEWSLIAIDGVFLRNDEVRSLNDAPYFGEYLLPPGGRLDVIVKCDVAGLYTIQTSENDAIDPDLVNIVRVPSGMVLFQIQVNNLGSDTVTVPPQSYPARPAYLTDLLTSTTTDCGCNTYFPTDNRAVTWTDPQCGFVFNMQGSHNINGLVFNHEPMTYLEYGKVYEFLFFPHMHPYHQHVNPLQLVTDIGTAGFQGKAGDWFDTIGGPKNIEFKFRTRPIDFTGHQVTHCHILPHEDQGMMTYLTILQPHQFCNSTTKTIVGEPTLRPTAQPTLSPSHSPSAAPTAQPTTPSQAPTPLVPTVPTASPTKTPSDNPTPSPTNVPTPSPTSVPTESPTFSPTSAPTDAPVHNPTSAPTQNPTANPSFSPTNAPSMNPTYSPSDSPTFSPSESPTLAPVQTPTVSPSQSPTFSPSLAPTQPPTNHPTRSPSIAPTDAPSESPSLAPSVSPTLAPSFSPTWSPSLAPTNAPSAAPSFNPSWSPSRSPSMAPSFPPTSAPSFSPSSAPSFSPSMNPTNAPSISPSVAPTFSPSAAPSRSPSIAPSLAPTRSPSNAPSLNPTLAPSVAPSLAPTLAPSLAPTFSPSLAPTRSPSNAPSLNPTLAPSIAPSLAPTLAPSVAPTYSPTLAPSLSPSNAPSLAPTNYPTDAPSLNPTIAPTYSPSAAPTDAPSIAPTLAPTNAPSLAPSNNPTLAPSNAPSVAPSRSPSDAPSFSPSKAPTQPPTNAPSLAPTAAPTLAPSLSPTETAIRPIKLNINNNNGLIPNVSVTAATLQNRANEYYNIWPSFVMFVACLVWL